MTAALGGATMVTMILTTPATLGLGTAADTSLTGARDHHGPGHRHHTATGTATATIAASLPWRGQTRPDSSQGGMPFETRLPGVIRRERPRHSSILREARGVAASRASFADPEPGLAAAAAPVQRGVVGDGGMTVETADVTETPITVTGRISVTSVVANEIETGDATGIAVTSEDGDHPRKEGVGHPSVGISEMAGTPP